MRQKSSSSQQGLWPKGTLLWILIKGWQGIKPQGVLEGSERIEMISYSFENIGDIVPGFEGKSLKVMFWRKKGTKYDSHKSLMLSDIDG